MTLHRFFLEGDLGNSAAQAVELALCEADRHHLVRVLRLVPGDRVVVADPRGIVAEATLVEVSAERVVADLDAPMARPGRPRIVLAPGLARRERMEFTVQKCTELGVDEIWPVLTQRCVVRMDEDRAGRRTERWRRIAEEAAKQSQRADVPAVREPLTLGALAAEAGRFDVVLVPWEESSSGGLGIGAALDTAGATAETTVLVVIGPEGGLTESEVATLEAAGGVAVTLGDTVLRTETAAVVAVALVAYELGALGGRGR
jgi:16S rRNA (uracil1498-N3)-methyltransferase